MSRQPIELIQFGPSHDGTHQWWTTLKFLIEQDSSPPLIGGIAIDITPRMRAEQALRASEDRYRSLVELAGSVIVVVDTDGRITEFNREAETFFGLSRADALDRSYVDCCVSEPHRSASVRRPGADPRRRVAAGPRVGLRPARRHPQIVSVERHPAHRRRQRRAPNCW